MREIRPCITEDGPLSGMYLVRIKRIENIFFPSDTFAQPRALTISPAQTTSLDFKVCGVFTQFIHNLSRAPDSKLISQFKGENRGTKRYGQDCLTSVKTVPRVFGAYLSILRGVTS
jgi:hypothetical protein